MNEDYVKGEMLENFSNSNKSPDYPLVWSDTVWEDKNVPMSCRMCSNHPINGGSGICWCVNGVPEIR
jgi:hypothetical protein